MNLCLGTVQFGLDYGIDGSKKTELDNAIEILDYATQNGVSALDTASAYGSAETVVGEFLKRKTINRNELFLCSKFKSNGLDGVAEADYEKVIETELDRQLTELHTNYLDAYMFHTSSYVFNDSMIEALYKAKQSGKVRYCGVSVYNPDEAVACVESQFTDIMQLPFSILDQRMNNEGVFQKALEKKNTMIHSRSAFTQGLILMDESQIPENLSGIKPYIKKVDEFCKGNSISRMALAMQFVKAFSAISHLVFGVVTLDALKENIEAFNTSISESTLLEFGKEFANIDPKLVVPTLWNK